MELWADAIVCKVKVKLMCKLEGFFLIFVRIVIKKKTVLGSNVTLGMISEYPA